MRALKTGFAFAAALAGLSSLTSCKEPEPENFGTIEIELGPVTLMPSPFDGTTEITATVVYGECLQDFYLRQKPEYLQDGIEGAEVFTEWYDKLCDPDLRKNIDCEVTDIDQNLIEATNVYTLKVTFKVNDPSSLAYSHVHVGPIPYEAFVECNDPPYIELNQNGLLGYNADGTNIWRVSALPDPNEAIAGQGAPLRVQIVSTLPDPMP